MKVNVSDITYLSDVRSCEIWSQISKMSIGLAEQSVLFLFPSFIALAVRWLLTLQDFWAWNIVVAQEIHRGQLKSQTLQYCSAPCPQFTVVHLDWLMCRRVQYLMLSRAAWEGSLLSSLFFRWKIPLIHSNLCVYIFLLAIQLCPYLNFFALY